MTATLPTPRPDQLAALSALDVTFADHRRAQLRVPSGVGKTLIGAWYARRCGARIAVVLVPSLNLIQQTAATWRRQYPTARMLLVCSDPSTAQGAEERGGPGAEDPFATTRDQGRAPKVTTRAPVVAHFLDSATKGDGLHIIIGTYQSSAVLSEAHRLADTHPTTDLLIFDEAHNVAGIPGVFGTLLRDSALPARRRLFMTATPLIIRNLNTTLDALEDAPRRGQMLSMDDAAVFGPVAYAMLAGDAIEQGLLSDYRVLVVADDPTEDTEDANAIAIKALTDAVVRFGVRRVLTYHNKVKNAHAFAARLNAAQTLAGVPVLAHAVDGTMPTRQLRAALGDLADTAAGDRVTVVASDRVLSEGVDVPAVDGVQFVHSRTSNVQIAQIIGRALRRAPGKTTATIILPVRLSSHDDDEEQLAESDFAAVWRVLRALKAHDPRITSQLEIAVRRWTANTAGTADPGWLHLIAPDRVDLTEVRTRLVRATTLVWDQKFKHLEAFAAAHREGAAALREKSDQNLHHWAAMQRSYYARGLLSEARVHQLESVPGWYWSATAAADRRAVDSLREFAAANGTVTENPTAPSIYGDLRDGLYRPIGLWLARTRRAYRDGTLAPGLVSDLEALPGWTWEPLDERDRQGVEALVSFIEWEHHTRVPADSIEGDFPLGEWVLELRRRYYLGTCPPDLEAEVYAVCPDSTGNRRRGWQWDKVGTQWRLAIEAASQYIEREGSLAGMPAGHVEPIAGSSVGLYQWIALKRTFYHRGKLAPETIALLEALPGWSWVGLNTRNLKPAPPIELPAGTPHGRRGRHYGCRCTVCLEASRSLHVAHKRNQHELLTRHYVPVGEVRRHLRGLFDTVPGATVGALAAAAGLSRGVIRGVLDESLDSLHPAHHQALRELTPELIAAERSVVRSRGRLGLASLEPADPGPPWQYIDTLYANGWTNAQIASELGYRRSGTLPFTREKVTIAQARAIRQLEQRLGPTPRPPLIRPEHRAPRGGGAAKLKAEQDARDLLRQGYRSPHVAARTGLSIPIVDSLAAPTDLAGPLPTQPTRRAAASR